MARRIRKGKDAARYCGFDLSDPAVAAWWASLPEEERKSLSGMTDRGDTFHHLGVVPAPMNERGPGYIPTFTECGLDINGEPEQQNK